jgi:murein DD-endopeptidase MepM/ murein hydrolase activator NlpD
VRSTASESMELLLGPRRRPGRSRFKRILWVVLVPALVVGGVHSFRVGREPTVSIQPKLRAVGPRTEVQIEAFEPGRGLVSVRVEAVQGNRKVELASESFKPQSAIWPWGTKTTSTAFSVVVGRTVDPALQEGSLSIEVTVERAGTWLLSPEPTVTTSSLAVRLAPPHLQVTTSQMYVAQGGAEVVGYEVSETSVRDGVRAGAWWFPGHPWPGQPAGTRFALFAVPFDMESAEDVVLAAEDELGNRAELGFVTEFHPKPFKRDIIEVSDDFMKKVVPGILAKTPGFSASGSLLEQYLAINSKLRRQNADTLIAMAKTSKPEFLWRGAFMQMPGKVFSAFADRRTYRYEGRDVDQQDHLGYDIASTQQADVIAANAGIVLFSGYLGIYGNTVVLDHGYGLTSLYGHLSSLLVQQGATVKLGQVIGKTGATGLALGDHLHFTMMLYGMPVNPIEWWDGSWIENRIGRKLGALVGDNIAAGG